MKKRQHKKVENKQRAATGIEPEPKTREDLPLHFRSASFEVRAPEGDNPGQVVMTVSSEEPVMTYMEFNDQYQRVYEVLDHSESSVDMSRMSDGLVIQDTHWGDQVGLMGATLKERKIGGPVTFCSGTRAKEIEQDALTNCAAT